MLGFNLGLNLRRDSVSSLTSRMSDHDNLTPNPTASPLPNFNPRIPGLLDIKADNSPHDKSMINPSSPINTPSHLSSKTYNQRRLSFVLKLKNDSQSGKFLNEYFSFFFCKKFN